MVAKVNKLNNTSNTVEAIQRFRDDCKEIATRKRDTEDKAKAHSKELWATWMKTNTSGFGTLPGSQRAYNHTAGGTSNKDHTPRDISEGEPQGVHDSPNAGGNSIEKK